MYIKSLGYLSNSEFNTNNSIYLKSIFYICLQAGFFKFYEN